MSRAPSRRQLLAGAMASAVAGLAGCGSGTGSDGSSTVGGTDDGDAASGDAGTRTDRATDTTETTAERPTTAPGPAFDLPDRVPVDEPFALGIDGLPDGTVDVRVETEDASGRRWSATATVEVTGGELDLDDATPVDWPVPGDLPASNTMALLQFLAPAGDETRYDPEPAETLRVTASAGGTALGSTSLTRYHGDPDVAVSAVDHDRLAGSLHLPSGTGSAPGVVVLHASDGRPDEFLARMLASNGFAALALRYLGGEAPSQRLLDVPLEYVDTACRWLLDREGVTGQQVGLLGDSKGGELALLAGSEFDVVGPVVSRNGSGVVWAGFTPQEFNAGSSWSRNGTSTAFVPYVEDPDLWSAGGLRRAYAASLENATDDRIEAATIPAEEIDGPVLLISGGRDGVWNAARLQAFAADRLAEAGRSDVEHVVYDDAGHVTTVPYRPVVALEARTPLTIGGTPAGHARASADHWPRVLETLGSLDRA